MRTWILIGLAGAAGTLMRYGIAIITGKMNWGFTGLPTLISNIIGCFLIGIIISLAAKGNRITEEVKVILAVGFCGGLTTFSSFTAENYSFLSGKNFLNFALYTSISVFTGLLAMWLGSLCVRN